MTIIKCCVNDIISSIISFKILYVFYTILWEIYLFHVLDCFLHCGICGVIVYEYDMIVIVFLLDDGF